MKRVASAITGLLLITAGCADQIKDFAREPHMTPVGAGLRPNRVAILSEPPPPPPSNGRGNNSFWQDTSADLFRDPRAMRVGDVMTVKISIRDKASLDNTSERKRDSKRNLNLDTSYNLNYPFLPFLKGQGDGTFDSSLNSGTTTKGQGAITRSESIELLVAAVVSDVLPNGNLVISGTQEVRVNHEVRVLSVAGVVRPRDIATDNSISYDKIAEARISYGGRGRVTEIQQPGWGHQLLDILLPY
jgi:flagellar L-ring protein precursor FlgH